MRRLIRAIFQIKLAYGYWKHQGFSIRLAWIRAGNVYSWRLK